MKRIALILLIIAVAAEFLAIYDVLYQKFLLGGALHIAGSLLAACVLEHSCRPRSFFFLLLLFLWNILIPGFGVFLGIFLWMNMRYRQRETHKYSNVFEESINLLQVRPVSSQYGEGGLRLKLFSSQQSVFERTKALFTLGKSQLAAINQQLYQLLPDSMDEMRLLAFNILDKQEGEITKNINQLFDKMEDAQRAGKQRDVAIYQKKLAQSYWELIYHHLILPELEKTVAQTALQLAHQACEVLSNDAGLQLTLAKLYVRLKEYSQAEKTLCKAQVLHALPSETIPYMAEIKYHERDYAAVQTLLNSDVRLRDIPQLVAIVKFWS